MSDMSEVRCKYCGNFRMSFDNECPCRAFKTYPTSTGTVYQSAQLRILEDKLKIAEEALQGIENYSLDLAIRYAVQKALKDISEVK